MVLMVWTCSLRLCCLAATKPSGRLFPTSTIGHFLRSGAERIKSETPRNPGTPKWAGSTSRETKRLVLTRPSESRLACADRADDIFHSHAVSNWWSEGLPVAVILFIRIPTYIYSKLVVEPNRDLTQFSQRGTKYTSVFS